MKTGIFHLNSLTDFFPFLGIGLRWLENIFLNQIANETGPFSGLN